MCTKGAKRRRRGGGGNYDRGPSAFPRKGWRPFRPGRGKEEKDGNEPQIPKVPKLRRGKGRKGFRAASPPKKSGVNRCWRKKSPSFSRRAGYFCAWFKGELASSFFPNPKAGEMYISVPFLSICVKGGQMYFFSQKVACQSTFFLCSNPFVRQEESVPHICTYTTHAFWLERVAYIQYIRE